MTIDSSEMAAHPDDFNDPVARVTYLERVFASRNSFYDEHTSISELYKLIYSGLRLSSDWAEARLFYEDFEARLGLLKPGEPVLATRQDELLLAGMVYPRSHGRRPFSFNITRSGEPKSYDRLSCTLEVPLWKTVMITEAYGTYLAGGGWSRYWQNVGKVSRTYELRDDPKIEDELRKTNLFIGRAEIEPLTLSSIPEISSAARLLMDAPQEIPVATNNAIAIIALLEAALN